MPVPALAYVFFLHLLVCLVFLTSTSVLHLEISINKLHGQVERASASRAVDLGSEFDYESGQTNDFKIGIHSFPA